MRKLYHVLFISLFAIITTETSAQTWQQIGADIDGEALGDQFGHSVSLSSDGSVVAIGAPKNDETGDAAGHVRIYNNQNGILTQIGVDIDGEAAYDNFGRSLSLSSDGSVVAIGAPNNSGTGPYSGHVCIYENQSGTWTQIGTDIEGEAMYDYSGSSVSLSSDGSIVAIGAPYNNGYYPDDGQVRIYKNQSGTWTQIGADIDGEAMEDGFGCSVSLSSDGSVVAIGADRNDGTGSDAGHVRIYKNQNGTWTQIGFDINGEAADDISGFSLSLSSDGSVVAIGAPYNDGNGDYAGHVRIYENQSGKWTQIGADIDSEAAGDWSGFSVSLNSDGSVVGIGATGNGSAGHVRIYENQDGTWTQIGADIDGEATNDQSGCSVSLNSDGSIVAIGARYNDGTGSDVGHVRLYTCNSYAIINPVACYTYTVPSGDEMYTASGVYYDTIPNAIGCDSIITINLTIANNTGTDVITACDSYTWIDGNTYTSNNNTATHTLTNINACDSVVTLDLTLNYSNTGTDVITACDSYTWIDGNTYTSSNNTATHTLTNVNGCDSVVTLDLTINTVDVSVTENGFALTANESGANYQWIDCDDSNNSITGETSQSFTANENGSFAVIVDNGLCTDTSMCYTITGVGINGIENISINIYPNPTNGIVEIDLAENEIHKVSITDMSGRKIIEKIPEAQKEKIDLSDFESGLYIIMFETDKEIYTSKIIKE